ncbi:hypothetical protein Gogos_005160, partial [Gossypium gossypioides]|nr:hypothetical protein [Gossypium gossypioides]
RFIWPCSFLCFVEETLAGLSIQEEEEAVTIPLGSKGPDGISISDLNEGRYLFRLYHKVDVDRIEAGGPWTFKSHLLAMHRLRGREDTMVSLVTIDF